MLLKIHVSIIILRQFLYSLYLCPYIDLGIFVWYLCDLFFIFIFIFIMIDRIMSGIQTHFFFCLFFRIGMSYYFWMITSIKNVNKIQIAKIQPRICLLFVRFSLALLIKTSVYLYFRGRCFLF